MKNLSFFADENIQGSIINWLKENRFNVSGIRLENLCGLKDEAIIEKAFLENLYKESQVLLYLFFKAWSS